MRFCTPEELTLVPYVATKSPYAAPANDIMVPARRTDALGWIQGYQLDGGRNYLPHLGLTTVRELALKYADKTRLVDRDALDEANAEVARLTASADRLQARVTDLEGRAERISGLARDGFRVMKERGPRTEKRSAA